MLEPLFGLIACLAIYGGVWAWRKVWSEFVPDSEFERWCAREPAIMMFRCGDARDTRFRLRALLAPSDELINLNGGHPWQYYRFSVIVREHADDVVAVHITGAIPQRGDFKHCTDAGELVARLVKLTTIEEVWLHGQLHPSEARSTARSQRSWLGRVADDGALEVTPMIGRPIWAGHNVDLHPDHG
jgi:hypothetical protein